MLVGLDWIGNDQMAILSARVGAFIVAFLQRIGDEVLAFVTGRPSAILRPLARYRADHRILPTRFTGPLKAATARADGWRQVMAGQKRFGRIYVASRPVRAAAVRA